MANTDQSEQLDAEAKERYHRNRALANWEPGYPGERIDYFEEFIQRHADIHCDWLDIPGNNRDQQDREATGVGVLIDDAYGSRHVVAPLYDGSICIWHVSTRTTVDQGGRGRLVGHSGPGHLTGRSDVSDSHAVMTETGAVECVSIDSQTQRGYFAVQNLLHEVDLKTLQLVSTKAYPFPITVLSAHSASAPLAVGTNNTVHLYDAREASKTDSAGSGELIGGSLSSHATLSQPGPLSIVHDPTSTSLWVSGRFTSLLNYDIRHFPRLLGTIHSGARIASLASLPHPFIPRDLDLIRNPSASLSALHTARTTPGSTLIAAAEYKGKGSLEVYGLPWTKQSYQNRQTASASKLLSAQPHGARIVFSDGDGNMRWFERNGSTHVRSWNVNTALPESNPNEGDASAGGIFSSSASEMPGQGDIVQKIVPLPAAKSSSPASRHDLPTEPLLLWTGDGRLGMLNFGQRPLSGGEDWHDALEAQAASAEDKAKQDAERQYGMAMRRALERNANEVRFVRGLGIGYGV